MMLCKLTKPKICWTNEFWVGTKKINIFSLTIRCQEIYGLNDVELAKAFGSIFIISIITSLMALGKTVFKIFISFYFNNHHEFLVSSFAGSWHSTK